MRAEKFDACISTGAAMAATILPMAALAGMPRTTSRAWPGRPVRRSPASSSQRAPEVHTLTQYREWATQKWRYAGSTLDEWCARVSPSKPGPLKILVTLGTIAP